MVARRKLCVFCRNLRRKVYFKMLKKVGIYGIMESNKFEGVETMKNKNLNDEIKEILFLLGFSTIVGTEYLNDAVEIAILSL